MADSTIGSLYSIRQGLEHDLLELQNILQKQGIDRHKIPFRPHIVSFMNGTKTIFRWYPDNTHELTSLLNDGMKRFDPAYPKVDIHAPSDLAFLNNSEVRKDVTIDVEIQYSRTGKRGESRHVRLHGPSIVDIFKTQNPMIPITPVQTRVLPFAFHEYFNNATMLNSFADNYTNEVKLELDADGNPVEKFTTGEMYNIADMMKVDFFIAERLEDMFHPRNNIYPQWGVGTPFGGLLVFPRFMFPTRFTTADADNTSLYPRYGIKGSGDKLHPNVMDFYQFKYDTDLFKTDPLTLTSNIYLTKHDGQPAADASHVYLDGSKYPDKPNGKEVYPNIYYAMMPTGTDYGLPKFNLYTSWKRLASTGTTVQSAFDVGKVDDAVVAATIPYPDKGVMHVELMMLDGPTLATSTVSSTLPDTAIVQRTEAIRYLNDQQYYTSIGGANAAVENTLSVSDIRTAWSANAGETYDTQRNAFGIINWAVGRMRAYPWPGNVTSNAALSLSNSEHIYQLISYRGKHEWDSLYSIATSGVDDFIPFACFAISEVGIYLRNFSVNLATDTDPEYQIYPDWNNYYGKAITNTMENRMPWANVMTGFPYSLRQSSNRAFIDHMSQQNFKWTTAGQNPFFRDVYAFDGIQPVREEIWYRNYVHAKTGREIFLAVACSGQRLFINDASTPNAPTWREVDIPLLPRENIRGICEYKGFYIFYTLFGYFFTTDFIDFGYYQVITGDKILFDESIRPTIEQVKNQNVLRKDWYVDNNEAFTQTCTTGQNYYCIDNMKIIEGYVYAAIKSNCNWALSDYFEAPDTPVNHTFNYQILRSKYPIFKQFAEYVTPYDVYINHSYVDIYGRKRNGFKMNPEFLIGGARQHRLYTPASTYLEGTINHLLGRKIYDNIIKCIEYKGDLYALKFRFSLPNFYFERPYLDGTKMAGPIHALMKSIPDIDHLKAEARLERIRPGLASEDDTSYTETLWVMNREIAACDIPTTEDAIWNDYLVWGLYDLSNFSNVMASRALGGGQGYAYKKGFVASPANGSFAMEVIDNKLIISFSAITNKYGVYSTAENYTPYSTVTPTTGWTPSKVNEMKFANNVMVVFDGETAYQLVNVETNWGLSYYFTKHPKWSTNRSCGTTSTESIDSDFGDHRSTWYREAMYFLVGYRAPATNTRLTPLGISVPITSTTTTGTDSAVNATAIKTNAMTITGTTDDSTSKTEKYPSCPPPGFMMPVTLYRYGIISSTNVLDGLTARSVTEDNGVFFYTERLELDKKTKVENNWMHCDTITGQPLYTDATPSRMYRSQKIQTSSFIDLKFICPQMEKPSDWSNVSSKFGNIHPFFNGFRVLNDRILALFGYVVADITTYNPPNTKYFTAGNNTTIDLSSAPTNTAAVLDIFKPAFADSKEEISKKQAMGQLWISPHDRIPVCIDGSTLGPTMEDRRFTMVDYTIDVQYIDGKYYQFLPGSIFVHEYVPCWNWHIKPWDAKLKNPPAKIPTYKWIHKVLWTTPLVRSTNPDDNPDPIRKMQTPLPTFNFWQINGRRPIYMNGYFFLPWCGLYVDLYGKTHSIPESSDFAPSEWAARFVGTAAPNYYATNDTFAYNQIGNHLGNETPYSDIYNHSSEVALNTCVTAIGTDKVEKFVYPAVFNYSGWNQFYKCGNRLYAYTPSAIGSQIRYIPSKASTGPMVGVNVVNSIPYDMRPGCQEYLAMTEYSGHKPQFYHKKINVWDYQYQWETVNGATQRVNRMIMQNKQYLMIDFPFHPTKVIAISRDRKLVISEYREFEFSATHGYFNDGKTNSGGLILPVIWKREGAIHTPGGWPDCHYIQGNRKHSGYMAHAICYEFKSDTGRVDLAELQTEDQNQIHPDEFSWIDNNTVYIYNPKPFDKGPDVRTPVFDENGNVLGQAGAYYDELPNSTKPGGIRTDYGYRFNIVDVYAWC